MTTKNLIPRASGEGGIGITDVTWGYGYYDTGNFNKGLFVSGHNITQVIAETVTQGGLGGEWTRNGLDIYYNGGNVGIGTTNPGGKLEVAEDNSENCSIRLRSNSQNGTILGALTELKSIGTNSTYGTDFTISNRDASDSFKERIRLVYNGNVGIGTASPIGPLHVSSASVNTINLTRELDIRNSANGAASKIQGGALVNASPSMGGAIGFALLDSDGTGAGTNTEGYLYFESKGSGASLTEKMRIDAAGNVGIGTANPGSKLDIETTSQTSDTILNLSWQHFNTTIDIEQRISWSFGDDTTISKPSKTAYIAGGKQAAYNIQQNRQSYLSFATENGIQQQQFGGIEPNYTPVERMRIDAAGNVGIGVASPEANLHIQGDDDEAYSPTNRLQKNRATLFVYNTSEINNSYSQLVLGNRQSTGSMSRIVSVLLQQGQSELSFSTTKNTVQQESMAISSDGVRVNNLTASSDVVTNASSYLTTSSDKRLKNDLGDCEYGLNEVLQVQPKRYTWKDGPKDANPTVGFFAQDVHDVMPEAAPREAIQNEKGEDDYKWGFHSQTIIAALVNATKEQQQLIEDLKSRIETLENK